MKKDVSEVIRKLKIKYIEHIVRINNEKLSNKVRT